MSKISITKEENETIANAFPGGEHTFYSQDLEPENKQDAEQWIKDDEMMTIVSEIHGGIIGYVHKEHADEITSVLNLFDISRTQSNK
jgi:Ca2+-binding EF-hand superfamily protein